MRRRYCLTLPVLLLLTACGSDAPPLLQGYAEAEYVWLAAALAGRLEQRPVQRGDTVRVGERLFVLEQAQEQAACTEAEQRLNQVRAQLANLQKGRRPDEIAILAAQQQQAEAALVLAKNELQRQQRLLTTKTVSREQFDAAQATFERAQAEVAERQAELHYAQLGARYDEIRAAEAAVAAAQAVLEQAQWRLAQKTVVAPVAGRVEITLFEPGEWVNAGSPVLALLPPANIKIRFFLPEPLLAQVQPGQSVQVRCDGCPAALTAHIRFIATQPEYTPPVIYSQQNRARLVFLVEATLPPEQAGQLHPGQPLDVSLSP